MRMKLGRPDMSSYQDLFDLDAAAGPVGVTFLGVSTLLFDDGKSSVLFDGFFSRPSLLRVATRPIAPDIARIDQVLRRLDVGLEAGQRRIDAVVPVHTHFDHVMDSAEVASRTGAVLVGGSSAAQVGRGAHLPEERIRTVVPGEPVVIGSWKLQFIASAHCPPDRFPGVISEPLIPPVKANAYKCGEAWSVLITHDSGRSALVQGSAGYVEDALDAWSADVAYLGVGQLGVQSEDYIRAYWAETAGAVGARRVVLTHWDDFFRSLERPLRALPYAGDDLDVTIRLLGQAAHADGTTLHLPTVWQREDAWHGLHQARWVRPK